MKTCMKQHTFSNKAEIKTTIRRRWYMCWDCNSERSKHETYQMEENSSDPGTETRSHLLSS
eukprot:4500668-Prorocentrum_lima.AAC.1